MEVKTAIPVEEYLRMSFDGPDWEYVDGEIVERNLGDFPHSIAKQRLIEIFYEIKKTQRLFAYPELTHRVTASRYRVPDVAIYRDAPPTERIPSTPPYVAVEVVSPSDRWSDIILKLEEYRTWGVPHIWLIDPRTKNLFVFDEQGVRELPELTLSDYGVTITIDQVTTAA